MLIRRQPKPNIPVTLQRAGSPMRGHKNEGSSAKLPYEKCSY